MVETAREEEREGDDSYLFSGPISIYTQYHRDKEEEERRREEKEESRRKEERWEGGE